VRQVIEPRVNRCESAGVTPGSRIALVISMKATNAYVNEG